MTTFVHCDACAKVIEPTRGHVNGTITYRIRGPKGEGMHQASLVADYCDADCAYKHLKDSGTSLYQRIKQSIQKYNE
jgi:hypothetical protein